MDKYLEILRKYLSPILSVTFGLVSMGIWIYSINPNNSSQLWYIATLVVAGIFGVCIFQFAYHLFFTRKLWTKTKEFLATIGNLGKTIAALSIMFYGGLYFTVLLLNNAITDAWIILLIAAFPLVIYVLLKLLDKIIRSQHAEFEGLGLKLKLSDEAISNEDNAYILTPDTLVWIEKGETKKLQNDVENAVKQGRTIRELRVVADGTREISIGAMNVSIRILTDKVPEFKYIVFVTSENKYLGFSTKDNFLTLYPYIEFDEFLGYPKSKIDELIDIISRSHQDLLPIIQRLREISNDNVIRKKIHHREQVDRNIPVNSEVISAISANVPALKNPNLLQAYYELESSNLDALPVINDSNEYIGIVEYKTIARNIFKKQLQELGN